jgi:hypothetical protein
MFKYLFYLEKDILLWNSRLWATHGSFLFLQCSYLQTVLISVFTVSGSFKQSRNAPFSFLLCFILFVSGPPSSCFSSWRPGERGNSASQKCCHYCVTKASVVSSVYIVIISGLDIWFGWNFVAAFLLLHSITWLWIKLTFIEVTKIFKTYFRSGLQGLHNSLYFLIVIIKTMTKLVATRRLILLCFTRVNYSSCSFWVIGCYIKLNVWFHILFSNISIVVISTFCKILELCFLCIKGWKNSLFM